MAAGPAGVRPILDPVQRLRWHVVAEHVAAVDGRPGGTRRRVDGDPHRVPQTAHEDPRVRAVGVGDQDGGPPWILLPTDVAARADADEQPTVRQHRHGPRRVDAARRQIEDRLAGSARAGPARARRRRACRYRPRTACRRPRRRASGRRRSRCRRRPSRRRPRRRRDRAARPRDRCHARRRAGSRRGRWP